MKIVRTDGMHSRARKLTEEQVYEIRRMYDAGQRDEEHAQQFGICKSHFASIGRRRTWKSLPEKK
jgi:hypothetical protein